MGAYIIRRLSLVIPTVFIVSLIVFFGMRLIPGDIVDLIAAEMSTNEPVDPAVVRHALGLDVPLPIQYGQWIGILPGADGSYNGLFQGSLGVSLWRQSPVLEEIFARWPVTLELGFMALVIAQLIALPVGVYSALRQDTWGDYVARSFATMCIAVPDFWLGTMIIVFPSIWWGYMPPIMLIHFAEDPIANLRMFIVPAIVLGMALSGTSMRMTRTMMLEVLRQDYIRTAWAKGLRERVVITRHALKNALIPVITLIGLHMGHLMGGTVVIETVFCLPGLGRLIIESTRLRDYAIVSGVLLLFAGAMVLINLIVDLTYAFLDPRIRYK